MGSFISRMWGRTAFSTKLGLNHLMSEMRVHFTRILTAAPNDYGHLPQLVECNPGTVMADAVENTVKLAIRHDR